MYKRKRVNRWKKAVCFAIGCALGASFMIAVCEIELSATATATKPVLFEIDTQPVKAEPMIVKTEPTTEPTTEQLTEPATEPAPVIDYSVEAEYIAKTVYGEARGCTTAEQEQVIWCILNRVDDPAFPDNIIDVIVQPYQFHGYNENNPVEPEHYELALDVLARWEIEKAGGESNRNLAPEYLFFHGDGKHNYFRITY